MILIKSKEELLPGMYCNITEENYNNLKEFGYKMPHNYYSNLIKQQNFYKSDILCIDEGFIIWKNIYSIDDRDEFYYTQFEFALGLNERIKD